MGAGGSGRGRFLRRWEPAHRKTEGGAVVQAVAVAAPFYDLHGAVDFEVDGGLEPIAPELGGAADEAGGVVPLRDQGAAGELLLEGERGLGSEQRGGEAVVVLGVAEQSI